MMTFHYRSLRRMNSRKIKSNFVLMTTHLHLCDNCLQTFFHLNALKGALDSPA